MRLFFHYQNKHLVQFQYLTCENYLHCLFFHLILLQKLPTFVLIANVLHKVHSTVFLNLSLLDYQYSFYCIIQLLLATYKHLIYHDSVLFLLLLLYFFLLQFLPFFETNFVSQSFLFYLLYHSSMLSFLIKSYLFSLVIVVQDNSYLLLVLTHSFLILLSIFIFYRIIFLIRYLILNFSLSLNCLLYVDFSCLKQNYSTDLKHFPYLSPNYRIHFLNFDNI